MNQITVTKENIWDVVEQLRSLNFGVTIGTLGNNQYSVGLVYWPLATSQFRPRFKEIITDSPETAMAQALKVTAQFLESVDDDGSVRFA